MGIKGSRVKEQRQALGLSQPELARILTNISGKKASQQSVEQCESKEDSNPQFSLYLPKALQTSSEYLTGRTSDPKSNDSYTELSQNGPRGSEAHTSREGSMGLEDVYFRLGNMEARLAALEAKKGPRAPRDKVGAGKSKGPQGGRRTS